MEEAAGEDSRTGLSRRSIQVTRVSLKTGGRPRLSNTLASEGVRKVYNSLFWL